MVEKYGRVITDPKLYLNPLRVRTSGKPFFLSFP